MLLWAFGLFRLQRNWAEDSAVCFGLLVGSETEILQLPSRTPLEPRCRKVV